MNVTRQKITTTAMRMSGSLSMLGCGYIMYEVLTSKKKRQGTYFRLMFCMSFIEFCDGLACFIGPWAVPAEYIPWWGTAGTHASCMFQAFLIEASIGSSLYNAALAIYYLLSIRYNWSERLLSKKVEPWMHGICLVLAYGMATAGIFLGIYGSMGAVCTTARFPPDCKETYKFGYTDCIYGDNASLYHIVFYEIWLWMAIFISAAGMCSVWSSVRNQENRNARYTQAFQTAANNSSNNNNNNSNGRQSGIDRKYSRRFAVQGALYVVVFYLCHLFSTFCFSMYHATGTWNLTLVGIASVFDPLEGFLNFLVYMRPRWIRYWKEAQKKRNVNASVSERSSTAYFFHNIIHFSRHNGRAASVDNFADESCTPTPSNSNSTTDNGGGIDPGISADSDGDRNAIATLRQEENEQISLDAY